MTKGKIMVMTKGEDNGNVKHNYSSQVSILMLVIMVFKHNCNAADNGDGDDEGDPRMGER